MRRRAFLQAGSTVAVASLAGCAAFSGDNKFMTWTPENGWPLASFGPRNTRTSPLASPPRSSPSETTSINSDERVRSLLASSDRVVVGTDTSLQAFTHELDPSWEKSTGGTVAALYDGTAYTAGRTNESVAVGAYGLANGEEDWETTTAYKESLTHLIPSENRLLLSGSSLRSFDRDLGSQNWSYDGSYSVQHVLGNNTLGFGTTGLHELELQSGISELQHGTTKATELLDTPTIDSPVCLIDGRYYFMTQFPNEGASIIAFEGTKQWGSPLADVSGYTGQAVSGSGVYAAGYETIETGYGAGVVGKYALDDGSEQWTRPTETWINAPVVAGNSESETILVGGGGSNGGNLYAFDAASGTELWNVTTESPIERVIPVGERVYIGTQGGQVLIIE